MSLKATGFNKNAVKYCGMAAQHHLTTLLIAADSRLCSLFLPDGF